jgi:hypothetical protein
MQRRTTIAIIAIAAAGLAIAGAGAAVAVPDDDGTDTPITGAALDRASAAALAHTGGGTVTGSEVDDEESYYEVEVRRPDGSSVDVQLDEGFTVVGQDADGAGANGTGDDDPSDQG